MAAWGRTTRRRCDVARAQQTGVAVRADHVVHCVRSLRPCGGRFGCVRAPNGCEPTARLEGNRNRCRAGRCRRLPGCCAGDRRQRAASGVLMRRTRAAWQSPTRIRQHDLPGTCDRTHWNTIDLEGRCRTGRQRSFPAGSVGCHTSAGVPETSTASGRAARHAYQARSSPKACVAVESDPLRRRSGSAKIPSTSASNC